MPNCCASLPLILCTFFVTERETLVFPPSPPRPQRHPVQTDWTTQVVGLFRKHEIRGTPDPWQEPPCSEHRHSMHCHMIRMGSVSYGGVADFAFVLLSSVGLRKRRCEALDLCYNEVSRARSGHESASACQRGGPDIRYRRRRAGAKTRHQEFQFVRHTTPDRLLLSTLCFRC